ARGETPRCNALRRCRRHRRDASDRTLLVCRAEFPSRRFHPALDGTLGAAWHRRHLARGIFVATEKPAIAAVARSALHRDHRRTWAGAKWLIPLQRPATPPPATNSAI